jgi:hypothetical protein
MSLGPEAVGGNQDMAAHERLLRVVEDWRADEEDKLPDRKDLGWDIALRCGGATHAFRFLQTLIVGENTTLPYAPPCVRIVTSRDGWKEDYALVYGYPGPGEEKSSDQATRLPEEAATFRIYYGANYGPAGYKKVDTIVDTDPAVLERFNRGEFTDDEAERLLADQEKDLRIYDELLIAARDPGLNPEFAESATAAFYRHADQSGL